MTELTSKQIAHLRGLGQKLEPIIHIGQAGLTEALVASVNQALDAHELVKAKFHALKEQKKELAPQLAERTGSVVVHRVGNVVVLYRQQADATKRRITM